VDIHTYSIGAAAVTTVRNRSSKSGPEKPIVMVWTCSKKRWRWKICYFV